MVGAVVWKKRELKTIYITESGDNHHHKIIIVSFISYEPVDSVQVWAASTAHVFRPACFLYNHTRQLSTTNSSSCPPHLALPF